MRVYSKTINVFDAAMDRIDYVFKNFERIYVSFSGGKDSGVMLNLVLRYMKENNIDKKVGVMVMDNEANYELSYKFMHKIIQENLDRLDVYWCCLPITLPCTVSSYEVEWQCWGEADKERWIRPMPKDDYIVNLQNHQFPFFKENMVYQEFWDQFGEWYSQGKSCASLIGIRADESLNRFRAIMNQEKVMHNGKIWTKKNGENVFNVYPIYDWRSKDIWLANEKNQWDYNELYDIFYKAGVPVGKMRVASPFMSESKSSLSLYKVIDPHIWAKLCARVGGANFVATYGKQLSYRTFTLPAGHTWKSFTKFLLATLPKSSSLNFRSRFVQSILYWGRVGRGLPKSIVKQLKKNKLRFKLNGKTAHGSQLLDRVRIQRYPDHVDFLTGDHSSVASWKRLALTILKNDHTCKYLGLAPTKEQMARQKHIMKKYKNIGKKKNENRSNV